MTKREKLELTIRNLQNALNKVQEDLKNLDSYERFVPRKDKDYWFIDDEGDILCDSNDDAIDKNRIDFYNCFRTEKETQYEKEKILIRRQLEDIANRNNSFYSKYLLADNRRLIASVFSTGECDTTRTCNACGRIRCRNITCKFYHS